MMRQYELVERVRGYDPAVDEEALNRAYVFSMHAHGSQTRASGDPYFSHPVEVAGILTEYRLDTASIVTGLLHDTVEDTVATIDEIEHLFGDEVARLVDGVTKLSKLELQSQNTRHAENFRKLLLAISEDIRVLLVKLADRVHNMRTLHYISVPEKRARIARETMDIYVPLAERIGIQDIKEELEEMAFRELYPEVAESIENRLEFLKEQGEDVVKLISGEVNRVLAEADLECWVSGRTKRPVSIWRKMQRKNVEYEQLTDIIAFRVIVASVEDCYRALGVIHTHYRMIPGEFDDYISTPKLNGYQSLHTALIGPEMQRIEIQIRTTQMHEVAELGVAAHWQYKQGAALTEGKRFHWVRQLLDILENSTSPGEFLEHTKLEMYPDDVFCFTPKGEIINLPQGATAIDFAYAVHSEVGDRCVGARINGKMAPLRTEIRNGDQVEILTSADGTPSPTWEQVVVTGKARARIRRYVRGERREEFTKLGQAMLDRAFRDVGYSIDQEQAEAVLEKFDAESMDELVAMVGSGEVTVPEVITALVPEKFLRQNPDEAGQDVPERLDWQSDEIPIRGLTDGMAVHHAKCCHPLPGDRIVGILTPGKGVAIHTKDCETLESFVDTPERWIDVGWDIGPVTLVGRIKTVVANKKGALGSLTTVIGQNHANINNLKITGRSEDFFDMTIDIEVNDTHHLNDVVAALRATPGVTAVDRDG
ncbi:MAG: bifunctional (p)ppGpp synthetase/guanosine-3',5'-bis(diphosphate) 3'-pyrophosphohydrolase [Rhodospirillaceae bacterium]|nr:MAG: bifunctional (p)ppGpp synthetase/guanosine-3',5'-bis(diphosphate) 3'-pyrophosphohydrolase [Rhodospirillaceae bacterium]